MQIADECKASYYGWLIVGMVFLTILTAFGLAFSFGMFLKPLATEFGWSRAATVGIFSTYAITHNLFAPFAGKICDRFGPKVTAAAAGICMGAATIQMSTISSIWVAYGVYAVIFGFGVGASYAPMMATASQWFSKKRGLAMGLAATGSGAGILCASPFAAWLISQFGWRTAFLVTGCCALAIFIPVILFLREAPKKNETGHENSLVEFSFSDALRTGSFWCYGFCWFFVSLAVVTMIVHLPSLLTDRNVPLTQAGFLLGIVGAASLVGRITGGFISDRTGRKPILLLGFLFQGIMLIWLLFSNDMWMLWVFAVCFGFGYGVWAGVIAAFPADYFGLKSTGTIFGFIMIFAGLGGAIGPYAGGYVYDVSQSYHLTILMCIFSTLLAVVVAVFLRPPRMANKSC